MSLSSVVNPRTVTAVGLVLLLANSVLVLPAWAQGVNSNGLQLTPPPNSAVTVPPNQQNYSYYAVNQPAPVIQGQVTAIPKGTTLMVRMDQPVNSESSHMGDPVSATVESDIFMDGRLIVPAGSIVYGAVSSVRTTGRVGQHGQIEIRFDSLKTPDGMSVPIRAHIVTADDTGIIRGNTEQARVLQTFGVAAGGAGAGTLFGTALGSLLGATGSGALFGLATGAIGGIGYAILRKGKQVIIPSGARMSIVVEQPVAVY